MTTVAVNSFDIDWTLKMVSTVTGVPPSRSVEPNPCRQTTWSPSTSASALGPPANLTNGAGWARSGRLVLG